MRSIMVLGGTGVVGGEVLRQLRSAPPGTHLIAPTRRPLDAFPEVENPIVDFAALEVDAHWWKVDALIGCMGSTLKKAGSREQFHLQDLEYPLAAARIARNAGVRTAAFVSSLGASSASANFYLNTKARFEDALADIGFDSLTILRPSVIDGERQEFRPAERMGLIALNAVKPLLPRRYRPSSAKDIAACLIHSVQNHAVGIRIVEAEDLAGHK